MERFAVDLTWVRPGSVGGTESYIRNLLSGMAQCKERNFQAVLLVSRDNYKNFQHYKKYMQYQLCICNTESARRWKRVLWQNIKMQKMLAGMGITRCFEPVYGKPFFKNRKVKFDTVIHDLQAFHYPEYGSRLRMLWMRFSWWNAVRTSDRLITISQFVKEDILEHYPYCFDKIHVIYNPVNIDTDACQKEELYAKYGVEERQYYYTVSSMLPHKNLITILRVAAELKKRKSPRFFPLVISGIGGKERDSLEKFIAGNALQKDIIFTDFISDRERNGLYKYCSAFLFPSIFEGFGMPPVEALGMGVPVLATKRTSLPEVTGGLCSYVEEPYNVQEWADRIEAGLEAPGEEKRNELLAKYSMHKIADQYIRLITGEKC